jgi:hypothetical protein
MLSQMDQQNFCCWLHLSFQRDFRAFADLLAWEANSHQAFSAFDMTQATLIFPPFSRI